MHLQKPSNSRPEEQSENPAMPSAKVTRKEFLEDRQGKTFADVANDPEQPLDVALEFFSNPDRQRRMEESEIHHDRAALAGVVRELEALPAINEFLGTKHPRRSQRLRQAIGVMVRMIMELRGWRKTGKKGSLGVRSAAAPGTPNHNTGGLAFWFVRAERYEHDKNSPYPSVRNRCRELESKKTSKSSAAKHPLRNGRSTKRSPPAARKARDT
jgi:hypothetical protein